MKIVSDIDGVWADQKAEVEHAWKNVIKFIAKSTGMQQGKITGLLDQCRTDISQEPSKNGWIPKQSEGNISVFYGEEPLGDLHAVFNFLSRTASENSFSIFRQDLFKIKNSILKSGFKSLEDFAAYSINESSKSLKETGKLAPSQGAKSSLEKVLKKPIQLVALADSSIEKIEHLFLKMGVKPTNEKSIIRNNVFIRSNAKRFEISNDYSELPEDLIINKHYRLKIRRKHFHKILCEELPDFVIGDSISLDIALPLHLRLHDSRFNNLKVILKLHDYTPAWVKDFLSKDEFKNIAFMIESLSELPDLLKWD